MISCLIRCLRHTLSYFATIDFFQNSSVHPPLENDPISVSGSNIFLWILSNYYCTFLLFVEFERIRAYILQVARKNTDSLKKSNRRIFTPGLVSYFCNIDVPVLQFF